MVEKFFGINYEFDFDAAIAGIDEKLRAGETGYICVSDGVILNTYHRNEGYRKVVDNAMFSICDSSYVPIYIRRIYGLERKQCSGTKFMELIVSQRKYTMAFVGGDKSILASLKENLMKMNPDVENMLFYELPFCKVADFDYEGIAAKINLSYEPRSSSSESSSSRLETVSPDSMSDRSASRSTPRFDMRETTLRYMLTSTP